MRHFNGSPATTQAAKASSSAELVCAWMDGRLRPRDPTTKGTRQTTSDQSVFDDRIRMGALDHARAGWLARLAYHRHPRLTSVVRHATIHTQTHRGRQASKQGAALPRTPAKHGAARLRQGTRIDSLYRLSARPTCIDPSTQPDTSHPQRASTAPTLIPPSPDRAPHGGDGGPTSPALAFSSLRIVAPGEGGG